MVKFENGVYLPKLSRSHIAKQALMTERIYSRSEEKGPENFMTVARLQQHGTELHADWDEGFAPSPSVALSCSITFCEVMGA
jgi:hypothetical protein